MGVQSVRLGSNPPRSVSMTPSSFRPIQSMATGTLATDTITSSSMWWKLGNQPIDLLVGIVEMRRAAEAAFSYGDFGFVILPEILPDFGVVVSGGGEADDAAPLVVVAGADDGIAFVLQACDQVVGQGADAGGDGINSSL